MEGIRHEAPSGHGGARAAGATCTQGRHAKYHTYGDKSTVFHLKVPIAGIHVIIFAYQSGVDTRESCSLRLRVASPASAVTFPRAELVADSATGRDLLPPNKRTSNFHRWHARLGGRQWHSCYCALRLRDTPHASAAAFPRIEKAADDATGARRLAASPTRAVGGPGAIGP